MDYWNFAEVMQYIAYRGFVFVNLSALIRWGIRRVKFLQRDVVGEDGKLYDFSCFEIMFPSILSHRLTGKSGGLFLEPVFAASFVPGHIFLRFRDLFWL